MKLEKWLSKKNKDYRWFAEKVGVSPVAVWYWLQGERTPRRAAIDKIIEVTGGSVKAADFY